MNHKKIRLLFECVSELLRKTAKYGQTENLTHTQAHIKTVLLSSA